MFLRGGNHMERDGSFAAGFWTVNFDNPAARKSADTQRNIKIQNSGWNGFNVKICDAAEPHYGAVIVLFVDVVHRLFERFSLRLGGGKFFLVLVFVFLSSHFKLLCKILVVDFGAFGCARPVDESAKFANIFVAFIDKNFRGIFSAPPRPAVNQQRPIFIWQRVQFVGANIFDWHEYSIWNVLFIVLFLCSNVDNQKFFFRRHEFSGFVGAEVSVTVA